MQKNLCLPLVLSRLNALWKCCRIHWNALYMLSWLKLSIIRLVRLFDNVMWCTMSQSLTNSAISMIVVILHKPLVQLWCSKSSLTVLFFLHAILNRLKAMSNGALPFSHDEWQNLAFSSHRLMSLPLKSWTIVCLLLRLKLQCTPTAYQIQPIHTKAWTNWTYRSALQQTEFCTSDYNFEEARCKGQAGYIVEFHCCHDVFNCYCLACLKNAPM